jgi:hypothetical protein
MRLRWLTGVLETQIAGFTQMGPEKQSEAANAFQEVEKAQGTVLIEEN